jgi:serine/threonine protein kinase
MRKYTRKIGGKRLGEGSKGTVYDFGCNSEGDSLCSILDAEEEDVTKIKLYTVNGDVILTDENDIRDFIRYVHGVKNKIAKIMKEREYNPFGYDYEIKQNIAINNMFGKKVSILTAIKANKGFGGLRIAGVRLSFVNKPDIFVVFGEKCEKGPLNMKRLLIDMLETLKYMQRVGLVHNDIKEDNIMFCGSRYKLIDWGNATTKQQTLRSGFYSGILKRWLITDSDVDETIANFKIRIKRKYPDLFQSHIFQSKLRNLIDEFMLIKDHGKAVVGEKYKGNHDLFAFGMTVMQMVITNGLDYEQYRGIVELSTSYLRQGEIDTILNLARGLR